MQMFAVVVLWAIFLLTQQLKSKYPNCTWQYFTIFGAQVIFLLGVTCLCIWYVLLPPSRPCKVFTWSHTSVNVKKYCSIWEHRCILKASA